MKKFLAISALLVLSACNSSPAPNDDGSLIDTILTTPEYDSTVEQIEVREAVEPVVDPPPSPPPVHLLNGDDKES